MNYFITLAIFLTFIGCCSAQQRFGASNPMCQARMPSCPNRDALGCCMYPQLFFKRIQRECKNNALQVTKPDGKIEYYEDSCFLTCLFKSAGYNANKNISGDFIMKALPDLDDGTFRSYRALAHETVERCKTYYTTAANTQDFANLYRRTLNQIDKKRPLCNLKLAAIWDCVHAFLLEKCGEIFVTKTSVCDSLSSFLYRCYFWGADY